MKKNKVYGSHEESLFLITHDQTSMICDSGGNLIDPSWRPPVDLHLLSLLRRGRRGRGGLAPRGRGEEVTFNNKSPLSPLRSVGRRGHFYPLIPTGKKVVARLLDRW